MRTQTVHTWEFEREDEDTMVDIVVHYTITDYDPGVTYGPAENCYPPEGGEVDIVKVMCNNIPIEYTSDEAEKWCEEIAENHDHSADYHDSDYLYEDYHDRLLEMV